MRSWFRGILLTTVLLAATALQAQAQNEVVFHEILIRRTGPSPTVDQLVELKNTGGFSMNVGGWVFCHEFDYSGATIPNGTTIAGGGLLTLHFNQSGTNTTSDVYFPGEDLSTTSDLALYINGNNFGSAANMHAFIQFGGIPGGGRQSIAAQAGLWTTNAFIPNPAIGASVELCAGDATQVTSWIGTSSPTIGATNGCGVAIEEVSWGSVKSIFRRLNGSGRFR